MSNQSKSFSISLIALLAAGGSLVYGDSGSFFNPRESKTEEVAEPSLPYNGRKEVTPSARPSSTYHTFVTADFLYWQAEIDNVLLANKDYDAVVSAGTPTHKFSTVYPKFAGDPGFRVGLGYNLPYDGWDLYANYTWFKNTTSLAKNPPVDGEFETYLGVADDAEKITNKWKLNFNTLDLELGRDYFISQAISFRPFACLKAAWIKQHYNAFFTSNVSAAGNRTVKIKNDFWGVGPRMGVNTRWHFKHGLGFFANMSGSLLYGKFTTKYRRIGDTTVTTPIYVSNKPRLRPTVQIFSGFDWACSCSKKYALKFAAGYEVQYWWSQYEFVSNANLYPSGDLAIHGLTASARFDF